MRKITAFTLLEILVVMTISGILFGMIFTFGVNSKFAYQRNQIYRDLATKLRNAKRDAMLTTRTPSDQWVHGVGYEFSCTVCQGATITPVKLVNTQSFSNFYLAYPSRDDVASSGRVYDFIKYNDSTTLPTDTVLLPGLNKGYVSGFTCSSNFRIIFETVTGAAHAYCGSNEIYYFEADANKNFMLMISRPGEYLLANVYQNSKRYVRVSYTGNIYIADQ